MKTPKTFNGLQSKLNSVKKYTTAAKIAKEFARVNESVEINYRGIDIYSGNDTVEVFNNGIEVFSKTYNKGIIYFSHR